MSSQAGTQQPSPIHFFETINAHQRTAALKAAIELDVFTAIGEGTDTARAIAELREASERGIRILCDFLVVIGFLTKSENRYALTTDSAAFLDRRSPACIASTAKFLTSPTLLDAFKDLTAAVKKGGTVMSDEGTMEPDHPVWVEFARAMAPMVALPAELIAQRLDAASGEKWKVLDIAAGHGLFGITIARHNPNAEIVAVDWSSVLEVAKENAEAAGVADRFSTIAGSAFDVDYGEGYDLALITNFLHHFDPATCEKVLRRIHAALKPAGRAVTLDFVPNEDRVTPPPAASFSTHLEAWRARLAAVAPFEAGALETALRALAEERGIKPATLIHATRVAVTGQAVSPGVFEVLELVGRERALARLEGALAR